MRYAFFGTSSFAAAILEKLLSDFFYPVLVVTQPDRPAGRHRTLTAPAVKMVCQDHNLALQQPEQIASLSQVLNELQLDLIIVAAYGQIIPKSVLEIPRLGAINVHASLLPYHRGASPIQAAILAGDEATGVTIMRMDEKMDHGDSIFQKTLPIEPTDTYRTLHSKLATLGSDVLAKVLPDIVNGRLSPTPQDHEIATYTKLIDKDMARLSFQDSAVINDRKVRAFYDWPLAWTVLPNGKRLNIIAAQPVELQNPVEAGTIVIDKDAVAIACASGALLLKEVQVEGKQKTAGDVFARGYHALHGQRCQ